MGISLRTYLFVALYSGLAACTTTQPASDQEQESTSIESPQPAWSRPDSPVPTATPPGAASSSPPAVAVLDPGDGDAPARHRQALLQSSEDSLAHNEVGYYIDVLEAGLIQQVRKDGVEITRQGNTFTLRLSGSHGFASNQSKLRPEVQLALASITAVLEEYRNIRISIYGHTDDVGEEHYNQGLSQRRARAVADYLVKGGVAAQRILIIGYGESRPRAANTSAEGRARNRRIELLLEPLEK